MKAKVRAFAPATVGNLSCGFDVLGLALEAPGDEVEVSLAPTPGVELAAVFGDKEKLPRDPEKNTATIAIQSFLKSIGSEQGVSVTLRKAMPIGSGLGSSAASAVAGVLAVNHLFDDVLGREELLPFVLKAEETVSGGIHADNVAPALLGGVTLIRSTAPLDVTALPIPEGLHCVVVHPQVEIATKAAREILKKKVALGLAVKQWGNLAGFVAGLYRSDFDLLARSLEDVIVEPERSLLIPGFESVKAAALSGGALGCGISGAGPSVFALVQSSAIGEVVGEKMKQAFSVAGLDSTVYVSAVNLQGAKILEVED